MIFPFALHNEVLQNLKYAKTPIKSVTVPHIPVPVEKSDI